MKVIIESYINDLQDNIDEVKASALSMVESLDTINDDVTKEGVITKLYYIAPRIGKILVVVSKKDAKILGVDSQIIADTDIKDYPLERMPSKIIDYKELIIKKGNNIGLEDIMNVAQAIADDAFRDDLPYKIPVVKIINYNGQVVKNLAMPSVFGDNVFYSLSGVVTNGNAEAGKSVIKELSGKIIVKTIDNVKYYIISSNFEFSEDNKYRKEILVGPGTKYAKYNKDFVHISGEASGDQGEKSVNEVQIPLTGLKKEKYVRILTRIFSYSNYYKYEFKILDKNNKKIFLKYTAGAGASNGVKVPHKEWFYAYMPILEDTAKYCIGESWGQTFDIKEVSIVDSIPSEKTTNGIANIKF